MSLKAALNKETRLWERHIFNNKPYPVLVTGISLVAGGLFGVFMAHTLGLAVLSMAFIKSALVFGGLGAVATAITATHRDAAAREKNTSKAMAIHTYSDVYRVVGNPATLGKINNICNYVFARTMPFLKEATLPEKVNRNIMRHVAEAEELLKETAVFDSKGNRVPSLPIARLYQPKKRAARHIIFNPQALPPQKTEPSPPPQEVRPEDLAVDISNLPTRPRIKLKEFKKKN